MSKIIQQGRLRADKILYPDGIGCCIWYPFEDEENAGICFDFPFEDIDDLILLLQQVKEATPDKHGEEI